MRIARTAMALIGVLTMGLAATPVLAQGQPVPPTHYTTDERGVDLTNGGYFPFVTEVVIGQPGAGGLVYGRSHIGTGWRDSLLGTMTVGDDIGGPVSVSIGGYSDQFIFSGSTPTNDFTPIVDNGAELTYDSGVYSYTTSDGTVATFDASLSAAASDYGEAIALLTSVASPNGELLTYSYRTEALCADSGCTSTTPTLRLQSITNNYGYQLKYEYEANGTGFATATQWLVVERVTGLNRGVDYCADLSDSCTFTETWPSVTYTEGTDSLTVTDEMNRETVYTYDEGRIASIRLPGNDEVDPNVSILYVDDTLVVDALTDASGAWNYQPDTLGGVAAFGPNGQEYRAIGSGGVVNEFHDADGEITVLTWVNYGQLASVTYPEGNSVEYTYDTRGNVTSVTQVAKPGSSLSDIVTSWTYPSTCSDPVTCNQPTSMTDARGFVTDYTYDADHGGLLTVTSPARYSGWDRPQTRIEYDAFEAWYKNSSGVIVASGLPVTLPDRTSTCAFTTTCAGLASERVSSVTYGASSALNNLLPTQISVGAGDASLTVTSSRTWTAAGDVASINGPLAGTDDRTVYFYNANREVVGMIGPDPDLTGSLAHRAMRITRDYTDRTIVTERGTTTGYSALNFASFTMLQQSETTHDFQWRPEETRFGDGTTTYSFTQFSYDASGRPDCTAARLNPSTFGSSPTGACAATTAGIYGQDRIGRTIYDDFGRVSATISGYGSGAPITQSVSYTDNGRLETLTDGEGNLTTWVYDGFDRVSQMHYPNVSGGGSSSTDYEALTYNASSLPVTRRLRDGSVLGFYYDNLNVLNLVDAPTGQQDVATYYDNLGLPYTAISTDVDAQTFTFVHDILGRQTSDSGPLGTVSYQYDAASRLTRITWPDSYYAGYEYDLTGALTAVRENGSTSGPGLLAAWAYDNLGRRTLFSRGNGVMTTYGWNSGSELTALVHNLSGTSQDQTFTYSTNPVGQLSARNAVNDAYAYTDDPALADAYTNDGLNRVTAVDSTSVTYDARQNITGDGVSTFAYDIYNRLNYANVHTAYGFDPVGRLARETSFGVERQFLYAGAQAIGEYDDDDDLITRFVPGAGLDDYAAYTQGTSTITRQWPITDQLGSVIGITDSSAVASQINAYDEYGVPAAGNAGRFGYAGSMFLSQGGEAPWHMRNRQYHPGLGRFLQTDPIGIAGGVNLYTYVGGDPINLRDPFGLQQDCWTPDCEVEVEEIVVIGCRIGSPCDDPCRLGNVDFFCTNDPYIYGETLDALSRRFPFVSSAVDSIGGIANATQCILRQSGADHANFGNQYMQSGLAAVTGASGFSRSHATRAAGAAAGSLIISVGGAFTLYGAGELALSGDRSEAIGALAGRVVRGAPALRSEIGELVESGVGDVASAMATEMGEGQQNPCS